MTAKRFTLVDDYKIGYDGDIFDLHKPSDIRSLVNVIGYVTDENEQLQQYKQSVSDVLLSWSQKNLTAKQLQIVIAIMEELNVMGD